MALQASGVLLMQAAFTSAPCCIIMQASGILLMQAAVTNAPCCMVMQASDMARKALESEDLGEDEMQPAPKLLEVILQNCRGRVDPYLPLYMQASLTQFITNKLL